MGKGTLTALAPEWPRWWPPTRVGPDGHTSTVTAVSPFFSRVLYGNKITEIAKGLFDGLVSLQLL